MTRWNVNEAELDLGEYRILEETGLGICGIHVRTGTKVALWRLGRSLYVDPCPDLFKRELSLFRDVDHPMISEFCDIIEREEVVFIVAECTTDYMYLSELDWRSGLEAQPKRYFCQILDVLEYFHGMGIFLGYFDFRHIVIDKNHNIRLRDIWFRWRFTSENPAFRCVCDDSILPYYVPPEYIKELRPSASAAGDLWNAGVLLYEMAVGDFPFGGTLGEVVRRTGVWRGVITRSE